MTHTTPEANDPSQNLVFHKIHAKQTYLGLVGGGGREGDK